MIVGRGIPCRVVFAAHIYIQFRTVETVEIVETVELRQLTVESVETVENNPAGHSDPYPPSITVECCNSFK